MDTHRCMYSQVLWLSIFHMCDSFCVKCKLLSHEQCHFLKRVNGSERDPRTVVSFESLPGEEAGAGREGLGGLLAEPGSCDFARGEL